MRVGRESERSPIAACKKTSSVIAAGKKLSIEWDRTLLSSCYPTRELLVSYSVSFAHAQNHSRHTRFE
eukprot:3252378-Amphidinium_carterae.1